MDEVDSIIILSLKSIGCVVEEDIVSLTQFSAELIYSSVYACLSKIKDAVDAPKKLPPGMSQRFKAGSSLAANVTQLGFKGEIGYQTFLYANESEVRKVLMYLIDKLPREQSSQQDTGTTGTLHDSIKSVISSSLKQVWLPPICSGKIRSQPFYGHRIISTPSKSDGSQHPASLREQSLNSTTLCSALIENNSLSLMTDQYNEWKISTPKQKNREETVQKIYEELVSERQSLHSITDTLNSSSSTNVTTDVRVDTGVTTTITADSQVEEKSDPAHVELTEEELIEQCENECSTLQSELDEVMKRIGKLTNRIQKAQQATEQEETQVTEKDKITAEKKKDYQVKKKTLNVLPEAQETIQKLNTMIAGADEKMAALEAQWQQHKQPLEVRKQELSEEAVMRREQIETKLVEINQMKLQIKTSTAENRNKDELIKTLTEEYKSMSKDLNRSSYTRKILEIVANIKKQKKAINKVLDDTRVLQKDINNLTGKLDRTFTVTDELIFKDARSDESVRAAYKYLASLHENCQCVRSCIEETGVILREIRELDDQIEMENKKDTGKTLKKITLDFEQIKEENRSLITKLKSLQ